jgi:purine-binding chemotaxis protein CheW
MKSSMATKRQLVVFRIGAEEFAVDIRLTKEIIAMREITAVPQTLAFVEGVMNLRGNLVPVLDLRKRLRAGRPEAHSHLRIIIALLDGKQMGLIVDAASEVVRASEEMIEPPPDVIREIGADYIEGIINLNERFITLLDLNKALAGEIENELEEVMKLVSSESLGRLQPARAV